MVAQLTAPLQGLGRCRSTTGASRRTPPDSTPNCVGRPRRPRS